jgi:hypothetical protein
MELPFLAQLLVDLFLPTVHKQKKVFHHEQQFLLKAHLITYQQEEYLLEITLLKLTLVVEQL